MKYFKVFILCSFFALVFGCVGIKASTASKVQLCVDKIEQGNFNRKIGYYTKNTGTAQHVLLEAARTSLTDPCTSCVIGFKLFMKDGTSFTGFSLTSGRSSYFNSDSAIPGEYKLGLMRADFTMLKTTADIVWTINS